MATSKEGWTRKKDSLTLKLHRIIILFLLLKTLKENKLGLERYTHKPVQLVRWWDQRHLVVVVDYLVIFYKLFTSYFNF